MRKLKRFKALDYYVSAVQLHYFRRSVLPSSNSKAFHNDRSTRMPIRSNIWSVRRTVKTKVSTSWLRDRNYQIGTHHGILYANMSTLIIITIDVWQWVESEQKVIVSSMHSWPATSEIEVFNESIRFIRMPHTRQFDSSRKNGTASIGEMKYSNCKPIRIKIGFDWKDKKSSRLWMDATLKMRFFHFFVTLGFEESAQVGAAFGHNRSSIVSSQVQPNNGEWAVWVSAELTFDAQRKWAIRHT